MPTREHVRLFAWAALYTVMVPVVAWALSPVAAWAAAAIGAYFYGRQVVIGRVP